MKNSNKPLLIVTSCTRNYGWVTRAFLECNTRWADYIIIVDQMSTDGTREMCAEYKNVILIDDKDMAYKENIRAKMAFMRGREIEGDRIFFALDIDEVMPANWMETDDGKKILTSKQGDMFQTKWANLMPDKKSYQWDTDEKGGWQYKIYHDDPKQEWQECGSNIHTPLLPYSSWEIEPTYVHDFPLLHFGYYFPLWNYHKARFYRFQYVKLHSYKTLISLLRDKADKVDLYVWAYLPIKQEWLYDDMNIFDLVDTSTTPIMLQYVKDMIAEDGIEKYAILDVYDKEYMQCLGLKKDPRPLRYRLLHRYIRATDKYRRKVIIRAIDKMLKILMK